MHPYFYEVVRKEFVKEIQYHVSDKKFKYPVIALNMLVEINPLRYEDKPIKNYRLCLLGDQFLKQVGQEFYDALVKEYIRGQCFYRDRSG